jgi:hypothetical protein
LGQWLLGRWLEPVREVVRVGLRCFKAKPLYIKASLGIGGGIALLFATAWLPCTTLITAFIYLILFDILDLKKLKMYDQYPLAELRLLLLPVCKMELPTDEIVAAKHWYILKIWIERWLMPLVMLWLGGLIAAILYKALLFNKNNIYSIIFNTIKVIGDRVAWVVLAPLGLFHHAITPPEQPLSIQHSYPHAYRLFHQITHGQDILVWRNLYWLQGGVILLLALSGLGHVVI